MDMYEVEFSPNKHVQIDVGDIIEFRECGFHRHTVYSVKHHAEGTFVMGKDYEEGGYSAFYMNPNDKGVKIIHQIKQQNKVTRPFLSTNESFVQISIFELSEE